MSLRFAGAALLALAIPLGACSVLKIVAGSTVPQKNVAVAVHAFDAVEVSATQYLRLPDCATTQSTLPDACRQPRVVPMLIRDVRGGRAARDSLWTASKGASGGASGGIGIKAAFDAVVAATAAIKQDLSR
jgi:hypothetical protein